MKKNLLNRTTAFALTGLILAGLLTGATPASQVLAAKTAAPAAAASSKFNEPGKFPILKNKTSFNIGVVQETNIQDRKTNLYTQLLEKQVNADLTFTELPPGNEAKQKLALLISSNSKLPDILIMGLSAIEVYNYGSQGFFRPLDDYYKNLSYFIKQGMSEYKENPMKYITSVDGKTYATPRIIEEIGNDWSYRHWINKTWLTKLGLSIPKTTDEYYNALKAFKEKDPNGNGKADEIPLIGSTNGWNALIYPTIMNAFIYSNKDNGYLLNVNGKLDVAYNKAEWKAGLEYMAKLTKEGLMSPLTFTQTNTQLQQIIQNKDAQLVGSLAIGSMSVYQNNDRVKDMTHLEPLKGPKGVAFATLTNSSIPGAWGFVTKDAKDPEAAFMVLDWMWSEEGAMLSRFGEKGVDWKDPDPGVKGLYEEMGYKPLIQYIKQIWGTAQNKHWSENTASRRSYAISAGICLNPYNEFDSQAMTAKAVPFYVDKADKNPVRGILYSPSEIEEVSEISASLTTFIEEQTVAFITGAKPLTEWDAYVNELKKIGLEKYLSISQKAYDRMNK